MNKKFLFVLFILLVSSVFCSFSKNWSKTVKGHIYISQTEPFTYPVLQGDDKKNYKIMTEKNDIINILYELQGKHLQIKGYIQEDDLYGLVIYPSSWKIIKE